jgi:hypothetical protein
MQMAWHHLACAARKRPAPVREALSQFPGEVPGRDEIEKLLAEADETAVAFPMPSAPPRDGRAASSAASRLPRARCAWPWSARSTWPGWRGWAQATCTRVRAEVHGDGRPAVSPAEELAEARRRGPRGARARTVPVEANRHGSETVLADQSPRPASLDDLFTRH